MLTSTACAVYLRVSDLTCLIEDEPLFKPLTFELRAAQILHVQGSNGIGKTSLLRVLTGMSSRYAGDLVWQVKRADALAYSGHTDSFHSQLSARDNLRYFAAIHGISLSSAQLQRLLAQVQLSRWQDDSAGQLSAGQQQRLKLAQLFCLQRPVWILDEPFTALDRPTVLWLEQQIVDHVQQQGVVLLTSHQAFTLQCAAYSCLTLEAV